jgi:hypothetical protein
MIPFIDQYKHWYIAQKKKIFYFAYLYHPAFWLSCQNPFTFTLIAENKQ